MSAGEKHREPIDRQRAGHPELRSFGRRKGRKLSPRQQSLVDELLPSVRLDVKRGASITEQFPPNLSRYWLEIGFGAGEHLLAQAQNNPSVGFIGCEPYLDGVVKVLSAIERGKLDQIRVFPDDAREVLRWLPDASIERVFVLFPDPWPKRKHVRRRLINQSTIAELARVLRPEGELRLATDIADYARTMLVAAGSEPRFCWLAEGPGDWRQRPADWPPTRYEAKAKREGRSCCYLRFRRL